MHTSQVLSTTAPPILRFTVARCRNILHTLEHDFSSYHIHASASVNGASIADIIIDTAADVPCVSAVFTRVRRHPTLDWDHGRPVPPEAINLCRADGSVLDVLGYIRLDLPLECTTLPIEALVFPHLGFQR